MEQPGAPRRPRRPKKTLKDAPKRPPAPPKHERKFLTEAEWRRLLKAAREDGLRSEALMLVMYECGMRREEPGVLRLSYAEDLHKGLLYVFRGKGSVDDRMHLTDVCRNALLTWIDEAYPQKRMRHPDLFIFPGRVNVGRGEDIDGFYGRKLQKGLSGRAVYNIFSRLADEARIPLVVRHPHVLKHSRVQHILNAGWKADIAVEKLYQSIAKIIGHAAARTTIEHYSQATSEEQALVDAVTEGLVK
jgi:integrase